MTNKIEVKLGGQTFTVLDDKAEVIKENMSFKIKHFDKEVSVTNEELDSLVNNYKIEPRNVIELVSKKCFNARIIASGVVSNNYIHLLGSVVNDICMSMNSILEIKRVEDCNTEDHEEFEKYKKRFKKIDEMISYLQSIKEEHGNIYVGCIDSIAYDEHCFEEGSHYKYTGIDTDESEVLQIRVSKEHNLSIDALILRHEW